MKKTFSTLSLTVFLVYGFLNAQHKLTGKQASEKIPGVSTIQYQEQSTIPSYIRFSGSQNLPLAKLDQWLKNNIKGFNAGSLKKIKTTEDQLGQTHHHFRQYYKGIPVEHSEYIVHTHNGNVTSINGDISGNFKNKKLSNALSENKALQKALNHLNAEKYRWEVKGGDKHLRKTTGNKSASYKPEGKKVWVESEQGNNDYRLAYKFDIYAVEPLKRVYIYIDAGNGKVLREINRICFINGKPHLHSGTTHSSPAKDIQTTQADASGTAETMYSGTRNITTDSYSGGYRLRESGRGNGIETYDMNESRLYSDAVDFTDSDNIWDTQTDYDHAAYDAHWGAEQTYDYFLNTFSRNSYDDNGAKMLSYVHYGVDFNNAFWDGTRMTYGDGSNSSGGLTPLTALDVVAHEFTHGVTEHTAGLVYQGESGALNEAFSDIFGTVLEFHARPGNANYQMGEQIMYDGGAMRDMSDPNKYKHPDTYEGNYWDPNEEVHTNSGVGNYWFYLTAEGGSGTNDNGDTYNVSGIGRDKAAAIAYRMLNVYLTASSNYSDARTYSILAASDLYGACSPEAEAVTNAWYAVGIGESYTPEVIADFSSSDTVSCSTPLQVNFNNQSTNATDFTWYFGDGSTSTANNPSHTYSSFGTYDVKLVADGGCGTDSTIKSSYIRIDSQAICVTKIPATGSGATQKNCEGIIYDDGGTSNYSNNSNGSITISPSNAARVTLNFKSFSFESGFDQLSVYDGPSTSSPLIGTYSGDSLPEGGTIVSSDSAITLQQTSDGSINYTGFRANWSCIKNNDPPVPAFEASPLTSCDGYVQFTDNSVNADSWSWEFGDGTTSSQQNPEKNYSAGGTYDIKLKVCNSHGCDSLTKTNYITVNLGSDCDYSVPTTGSQTSTNCSGTLTDDGGTEDYSNNSSGVFTIDPENAATVTLNFNSFNFESGYDYLYVYDGPSTSSPLIGTYDGTTLPEGGTITSSGDAITVEQVTDGSVRRSGFELSWSCSTPDNKPTVDFEASPVVSCNGEIQFTDQSTGTPTSWEWTFGDGTSSTQQNPQKSYTANGTYDIKLKACNLNGCDSLTKTNYVRVNLDSTCNSEETMPESGSTTFTSCQGTLYDDGGPNSDYSNSTNGVVTIEPDQATNVTLNFNAFSFESTYDYLYVYDGPSTSSPLIGSYDGTSLPEGGTITSSGGAITIRQSTDNIITQSGFALNWSCNQNNNKPNADFVSIIQNECNGEVQFRDTSAYNPTSWEWTFGDGTTSTQENPFKVYNNRGAYNVKLKVCNSNGCDSITQSITLNTDCETMPESGSTTFTSCQGTLYDDGGPNSDYSNSTDGVVTIDPDRATNVTLNFNDFHFESGYDTLMVYDGNSTSSPLIGYYDGTSLPEGGTITSSGGAITIRQNTDIIEPRSGFALNWQCETITQSNNTLDNSGKEQKLRVYPNPARDHASISYRFEGKKQLTVKVISSLQKEVFREKGTYSGNYSKAINTSSLASGIYFIKIDAGDAAKMRKLIIH